MNFTEYQRLAWGTALNPDAENYLFYLALGLGEAGEVQNKIKKVIRDDDGKITEKRRDELISEIGDLMWYIAGVCTKLGVSMDTVAQYNINKLASRKERGVLKGDGDKR